MCDMPLGLSPFRRLLCRIEPVSVARERTPHGSLRESLMLNSMRDIVLHYQSPGGSLVLRFSFVTSIILFTLVPLCDASPALRLTNSTVGPVSITVGGSVAGPLLEAYNGGDGNLTLGTPQISVSWITATIGAAAPCQTTTLASTCFPIHLQLNAASLTAST